MATCGRKTVSHTVHMPEGAHSSRRPSHGWIICMSRRGRKVTKYKKIGSG